MDFSKAENIIFVAAMGIVTLAMLAFLLTLIIKDKHKTCALDIALRIFCVLVLIVSLALSVLAVFTMLDGDFRIDVKDGAAALITGSEIIELPMPALFVALSDIIGAALCFAPAVLSLIVLILDCARARKNYEPAKPKKAPADARTPEEKKRDAEIERIRRLASSAVKKTSSAASAETVKSTAAEENTAENNSSVSPDVADNAEEEEDFDWRVDPAPAPTQSGFVGIPNTSDDAFDTFDSFDEPEVGSATEENEYDGNADSATQENFVDTADSEEYADSTVDDASAFDGGEQTAEKSGGFVLKDDDDGDIEPSAFDGGEPENFDDNENFDGLTEEDFEPNRDFYIPEIRTITKTHRDYTEPDMPEIKRPKRKHAYVDRSGDALKQEIQVDEPIYDEEPIAPPIARETEKSPRHTSPIDAAKREHAEAVKRKIAQVRKAHETSAAKRRAAEKAASTEQTAAAPIKKPIKRPSTVKKDNTADAVAKKPAAAKGSAKQKRETAATVDGNTDAKKLPVTRRYVIIDRTSAVNIFNEYLKERDRAEKDKIESMVSTIILK